VHRAVPCLDATLIILVAVFLAGIHRRRKLSGRQLAFAQQPCLLELLDVGQVAQRVEPELRQESFRGDEG
jgi:hypothetical protein